MTMKILGFLAALMLSVASYGQGTSLDVRGGGGMNFMEPVPSILGPSSGTEGSTITFSNAMFSAWTGSGIVETNYCTFTNVLANGTVSQQVQTVTLNNGRATGSKTVIVVPASPVANFTATPTSGQPPLSVLFTNLTTGAITNSLWTFSNPSSTNSFRTNAMSFVRSFADVATNTVSLTVAGYSTSTFTRTNYVTAVSNAPLGSLIFDGTQNYASATNSTTFASGGPFTVDFWVNTSADGSGLGSFVSCGTTSNGWVFVVIPTGIMQFEVLNGNADFSVSTTAINDSIWHHIRGMQDGTNRWLFVDGILEGTAPMVAAYTPSTVDLSVGNGHYGFVTGAVTLVRFYNGLMSTNNFTPPTSYTPDASTALIWTMGEGTGPTSADQSGNGNTLNLFGTPVPEWSTNAP